MALVGFEPTHPQWIADFLTTLCYHSRVNVVVWTMSLPYPRDLGSWCIVSTHLGDTYRHLARRCPLRGFHRFSQHSHRKFPVLVLLLIDVEYYIVELIYRREHNFHLRQLILKYLMLDVHYYLFLVRQQKFHQKQ